MRKRSIHWTYFNQCDSNNAAKCEICGNVIKTSGNASNLRMHLQRHHPEKYKNLEDEKEFLLTKKRTSDEANNSITNYFEPTNHYHYPTNSRRCQEIDQSLIEMICDNLLSFHVVETETFQKFVKTLDNRYKCPGRKYVSNNLLDNCYNLKSEEVKNLIKKSSHINLTSDLWTDEKNKVSYIGITCHFIFKTDTNDLKIKSYTLKTEYFEGRHTGENICQKIKNCLVEWEIDEKIFCVITDNGANMVAAVRIGEWQRLPCFDHTLNLIVTDAIKIVGLTNTVVKVRQIVHLFKSSTTANSVLKKLKEKNNIKYSLKKDVPTRWNSLLIMLKSVLNLQEVLPIALSTIEKPANWDGDIPTLTSVDWNNISSMIQVLTPFDEVTKDMSAEKYITISKVIPVTKCLTANLETMELSAPVAKQLKQELLKGINHRMGLQEQNSNLVRATLLDPRFKQLLLTNNVFEKQKKKIKEELVGSCNNNIESENFGIESVPTTSSNSESESHELSLWHYLEQKSRALAATPERSYDPVEEEIKIYFKEHVIPRSADPLAWWNTEGKRFPQLRSLVEKYLSIPATSVPCERIFSQSGMLLDSKSSNLKCDKVNKIIFIKMNIN